MKRPMAIIGVGIVLLFVLTAAVSGERNVEKPNKINMQTATDKSTNVDETSATTTTVVEPDFGSTSEVTDMNPSSVESPVDADNYSIPWQSINAGGRDLSSANYQMQSSVGQSVIGYAASASYQHGIGYWYGMGGSACVCGTPVGDVNCDVAVNPVDVVYMVNYVYKNQDARCYPGGWNCPYDPGDVDCNGGVNPVDVVYYVNYVYKNQNAFCDPCAD